MKDFIHDTWADFNADLKENKLYLFGLKPAYKMIRQMQSFGMAWEIEAILDNDSAAYGKLNIGGVYYEVVNPNVLEKNPAGNIVILICGTYTFEMRQQLESMGVCNYYSEFWMNRPIELKRVDSQLIDEKTVSKVEEMLCDEASKSILHRIIKKRKVGEIDYTDILYRGKSEYFSDEFWEPVPDGIYIDGGGYDGDTVEEIARWTKGNFKKIYTFEPEKDKAAFIKDNVEWRYAGRVILYENALWSSETVLSFEKGNDVTCGNVKEDGGDRVKTVVLDYIIQDKVSFVKMDIEGAELEALKGAKNILVRDKPNLAICVYHKPNDIWEIPILLKEMVPEYKFYMRHCGCSFFGTVLYAKV